MKRLGIRWKFFLPIGVLLSVAIIITVSIVIKRQNEDLENAFLSELSMLASASRQMIHSSAVEYAKTRGFELHQVSAESMDENNAGSSLDREAYRVFKNDSKKDSFEVEQIKDGIHRLYVYSPARYQSECTMCHNPNGVDNLSRYKEGDLVAVFGVSASMEELRSKESTAIVVAIGIAIFVLFAISWLIHLLFGKLLLKPMNEIALQSERIAEGNLTQFNTPELEKKMNSQDEIGALARSFSTMVDGLRTLVSEVKKSAGAVANSTSEIGATTEEMAAAVQEQAAQATEITATVEEMTKTIVENSKSSRVASDTATNARQAAVEGGKRVEQTVKGMKEIAQVVRNSSQIVKALGKSSDQIGAIINVIDDIADQTNLLALNAAIEAARAGEHGRGFAVVADEVRKLAERTTKATKEIADMIKQIQSETTNVVGTMEQGTKQVDFGITLADKAGESLQQLVSVSQEVNDMVMQIAAVSEQQTTANEEIARNLDSIRNVTEQTATGTQQIANSVDALNRMTDNLQGLLEKFRVDDDSKLKDLSQIKDIKNSYLNLPVEHEVHVA
jgi:methyl-accepting chemotaxis protein